MASERKRQKERLRWARYLVKIGVRVDGYVTVPPGSLGRRNARVYTGHHWNIPPWTYVLEERTDFWIPGEHAYDPYR